MSTQKRSVLCIGNFDGVHTGHQQLLAIGKAESLSREVDFIALTFSPHPRQVLQKQESLLLTPDSLKTYWLKHYGVDHVVSLPFQDIAHTIAEDFIKHIIIEQLEPQLVITGENFCFGRGADGKPSLMKEKLDAAGIEYKICPLYKIGEETVSSSKIRKQLSQGDVEEATQFLGHPFMIEGVVEKGAQLGRTLSFPTANIKLGGILIPKWGVYAITATMEGRTYKGVANIGSRPTVDGKTISLEAHLFDFTGNLYGKTITVALHHFLRSEEKFINLDALRAQIELDSEKARQWLEEHKGIWFHV